MIRDPFFLRLLAILLGFLVDCVIGDPAGLPHPVIFIGKLISRSEKTLRKLFPKTPRGEFYAGAVMAFFVPVISAAVPFGILFLCQPFICQIQKLRRRVLFVLSVKSFKIVCDF